MNDEGNFHEVEQQVPIHEQSLSHGAGKGILARCMATSLEESQFEQLGLPPAT
jgi:hypothetical protein